MTRTERALLALRTRLESQRFGALKKAAILADQIDRLSEALDALRKIEEG